VTAAGPAAPAAGTSHPCPASGAGETGRDTLVDAVRNEDLDADVRVWAAGEAAAVQRIRRYLFQDRGLARTQAVVRGYWKHGRGGDAET